MLKIYLKRVTQIINHDGITYDIDSSCRYVIEDEECVKSYTREYNIYSDNINSVSCSCSYYEGKRGAEVTVYGDDCFLHFKSWKHPDVKLIEFVEYEERSCSMRELCSLPADKVIAYLKQEGLNFTLTN
jgi:hypothetical protein